MAFIATLPLIKTCPPANGLCRIERTARQQHSRLTAMSKSKTAVCKECKTVFDKERNTDQSCRYHSGYHSGLLNRVAPTETSGLAYFWNCCGQADKEAPGCVVTKHVTYDD